MVLTEKIRSLIKQLALIILLHTILLLMYTYAHAKLDLFYLMSLHYPSLALLLLAPIVATFFLSNRFSRQGAVALLGILPAEMISNIVTRFYTSPLVPSWRFALIWRIVYEGSFGIVLILEVIGFWLAIKILREIYKQIVPGGKNST